MLQLVNIYVCVCVCVCVCVPDHIFYVARVSKRTILLILHLFFSDRRVRFDNMSAQSIKSPIAGAARSEGRIGT
jgi:hypothetical protein